MAEIEKALQELQKAIESNNDVSTIKVTITLKKSKQGKNK